MEKTPVTPVIGHLTQNWPDVNTRNPAIIVNPNASPLDLMSWCWAELRSMEAVCDVFVSGAQDIPIGDFSASIFYRIQPLTGVLEEAMRQLYRDAVQSGRV